MADLIVHDVQLRALLLQLAPCCAAQVVAGKHEPRQIVASAYSTSSHHSKLLNSVSKEHVICHPRRLMSAAKDKDL